MSRSQRRSSATLPCALAIAAAPRSLASAAWSSSSYSARILSTSGSHHTSSCELAGDRGGVERRTRGVGPAGPRLQIGEQREPVRHPGERA